MGRAFLSSSNSICNPGECTLTTDIEQGKELLRAIDTLHSKVRLLLCPTLPTSHSSSAIWLEYSRVYEGCREANDTAVRLQREAGAPVSIDLSKELQDIAERRVADF